MHWLLKCELQPVAIPLLLPLLLPCLTAVLQTATRQPPQLQHQVTPCPWWKLLLPAELTLMPPPPPPPPLQLLLLLLLLSTRAPQHLPGPLHLKLCPSTSLFL